MQVLLVVLLGVVELARLGGRPGLRRDLAVARARQGRRERRARPLEGLALLLRRPVHGRPVLRPEVVPLPEALRRVVRLPEHPEQLVLRDPRRVVGHEHRLGVAGPPGARLLVRRVRRVPALVPDGGRDDAGHLPERLLRPPEAAHRQVQHPGALGPRALQRGPEDGVGRRHLVRPPAAARQRLGRGHHRRLQLATENHLVLLVGADRSTRRQQRRARGKFPAPVRRRPPAATPSLRRQVRAPPSARPARAARRRPRAAPAAARTGSAAATRTRRRRRTAARRSAGRRATAPRSRPRCCAAPAAGTTGPSRPPASAPPSPAGGSASAACSARHCRASSARRRRTIGASPSSRCAAASCSSTGPARSSAARSPASCRMSGPLGADPPDPQPAPHRLADRPERDDAPRPRHGGERRLLGRRPAELARRSRRLRGLVGDRDDAGVGQRGRHRLPGRGAMICPVGLWQSGISAANRAPVWRSSVRACSASHPSSTGIGTGRAPTPGGWRRS